MKQRDTRLVFCLMAFLLFATVAPAQTQQGMVKTRGRMVNGVLQKGQPLSGATVQIKNRQAMVSGNGGKFSFPVRENTFLLQSVKKNGYQLVDQEACRSYQYSTNPLYVIMDTPEQQQADLLEAQRKIRRTLQQQLQRKEDEIEALQVSVAQKQQLLEKLYKDQENNEKLISEMAKRYAEMDYDQLDELNRQISDAIINGRLTRADSLLRTKGDIQQRLQELQEHEQANAKVRQDLEKSEALARQRREDLINDCYHRYEIYEMEQQYDSAAYYICLRADLDSTNLKHQIDAAVFLRDQRRMARAKDYSLRSARLMFGKTEQGYMIKNNPGIAEMILTMVNLAETLFDGGRDNDVGLRLYEVLIKSMDDSTKNLNEQELESEFMQNFSLITAYIRKNAAKLYLRARQYERSEQLYTQALDLLQQFTPKNDDEHISLYDSYLVSVYNGLADIYLFTKRYSDCELAATNAMSAIWNGMSHSHDKEDLEIRMAGTQQTLGDLYRITKRYDESEKAQKTRIEILETYAKKNPQRYERSLTYAQRSLGYFYNEMKRYGDCADIHEQAVEVLRKLSVEEPVEHKSKFARLLGNLSYCRVITCQYVKAEQYAREALALDSTQLWIATNLAAAILMQGRYDEAEKLYRQLKGEKKESLLSDLQAYAEAGAIPKEREADVERIKNMLNEVSK